MENSTATNELLEWERQLKIDKARGRRANLKLLGNFVLVLVTIVLTIAVAYVLAKTRTG